MTENKYVMGYLAYWDELLLAPGRRSDSRFGRTSQRSGDDAPGHSPAAQ